MEKKYLSLFFEGTKMRNESENKIEGEIENKRGVMGKVLKKRK